MSDLGGGMVTGDYDNETASLEEKLLAGKLENVNAESSEESSGDGLGEIIDRWEADGGRRSGH